jgi:hypothetical protein
MRQARVRRRRAMLTDHAFGAGSRNSGVGRARSRRPRAGDESGAASGRGRDRRRRPLAGPSHLPAWLDCVCRANGWVDVTRLYEMPGGRRLMLPLVRKAFVGTPGHSKLLTIQASFPHGWGSGGILAPRGTRTEDAALVLADLADAPGLRTLVRPGFYAAAAWGEAWSRGWGGGRQGALETPRAIHVLDLGGGIEEVWSTRLSSKARTGISNARRKVDNAVLDIEVGSSPQLVADFYDIYLRWLDSRARERGYRARWPAGGGGEPNRCAGSKRSQRRSATGAGSGSRAVTGSPSPRPSPFFMGRSPSAGGPSATACWPAHCGRTSWCSFLPSSTPARSGVGTSTWANRAVSPGSPMSRIDLALRNTALPSMRFERVPISRIEAGLVALRGRVESRALARYRRQ